MLTAKVAAFVGNALSRVAFKPFPKTLYPSAEIDFLMQSKYPEYLYTSLPTEYKESFNRLFEMLRKNIESKNITQHLMIKNS